MDGRAPAAGGDGGGWDPNDRAWLRESRLASGAGARAPLLGAVAGAVLASLCCVVPLLLLALGASTAAAGAFSFFKPYRPFFAVLALAAVALAWWRAYRSPGDCAAGSACPAGGPTGRSRLTLWAASAVVIALLLLPNTLAALGRSPAFLLGAGASPVDAGADVAPPGGEVDGLVSAGGGLGVPAALEAGRGERRGAPVATVTMRISGMTCASCPLIVRKAIERVPGVAAAAVTLEPPEAVVTVSDPALDPKALVAAVEQAGYGATLVKTVRKPPQER